MAVRTRNTVIALTPFERPDVRLAAAAADAGARAVLDLGHDPQLAARAFASAHGRVRDLAVRVGDPRVLAARAIELPADITVIVDGADHLAIAALAPRPIIAQATSLAEARAAIAAGAAGIIAKGCEAGGRIGDETAFVLAQRLIAAFPDHPVWVQGGIGEHTAAACIAGGAAGVVIDSQLALVREASTPTAVRAALRAMDGSETIIAADGRRMFTRAGEPIALGQCGAIAKRFATGTAAAAIRAITAAIDRNLELAAEHQPLAPGSAWARAHNLHYPIAQGPMSRVSDRARFAAAVADAGGLPFVALTLMTGDETRELLVETQRLLAGRPWGVGILGFVPPDVRERQLAVLRDIAPPIALIAGGRPSQAHPLEAQGTQTYLHVPSPGLLDLFLRDGARKFVFEGSECGGHVGPRTSFALWDAQIARLLAHPEPSELSLLFAGGIHEARSAAMVSAMAAPLAARGAKVGVLMGSAYVFTHEAVDAGAIEAGFQQVAVGCDRTVLLETSPGHATRCADTAYADAFAREKQRLADDGVAQQAAWLALEQMNLGRLRIAAKGLRRDGDQIAPVAAADQQRDGMYMIGQVAALRDRTCSIAELHRDVSDGARDRIAALAAARAHARAGEQLAELPPPPPADIAIVGLAAIMPGAADTGAFWSNIVAGKNAIREVPAERWSVDTYYDPAATGAELAGKKTPCKWGGFLDDVPFDPLAYGIPPKSLTAIEPVQLLALEIAKRALDDSGYDGPAARAFDRSRCAVIFGAEAGTDLASAYTFRALFPQLAGPIPPALDAQLPTLSEDSFPGVLSNVIAGRIANRLDLGGSNFTVDAACASSLAALDMAVKELAAGTSDMVLCGGADLHNSINDYLLFASVHALSPTGQCHTFDAHADGIVLGEGVACVVLKRLADAERDGDRIYAVVRAVAGASDGKSLGLTAPRKEGQVRALERAYAQARISPAAVGLVEAHGTGTVVGDRTELATLTDVFARAGATLGGCVLGSVKSQIGHTKCTAGMAGLVKAALAIHHGVLPPTSNIKAPNPAWQPAASPFSFLDGAKPWTAPSRIAAVSAFGFGGTNFHCVLSSHSGAPRAADAAASELVLVRGDDRAAAIARAEALAVAGRRLCDIARTVAADTGTVQVAIVADSVADLRDKLAAARDGRAHRDVFTAAAAGAFGDGRVAMVCPGQGSQKPHMLGELFVAYPRLHRWLELGAQWTPTMFPRAAFTASDKAAQADALTDTRVAQPALGITALAAADWLASVGVEPAWLAGHSYGELAALAIAGAIAPADLLALSAARGEHIVAAAAAAGSGGDPGAMAAVAADARTVEPIAHATGTVIANRNSPKQCVLSGSSAAIDAALAELKTAGLGAKRLAVACAFHSPIVAGAADALAASLAAIEIRAPRVDVWATATGERYSRVPSEIRAQLAAQVAQPVRFAEQIEAMYAAGARVFVEAGPGQVLSRLVDDIIGERAHVAVSIGQGHLRALAQLAAAGVAIDADALFWDRGAVIVDDRAPAPTVASWVVNGARAKPVVAAATAEAGHRASSVGRPEKPAPRAAAIATAPRTATAMLAAPPIAAPPIVVGGEREAAVVEYLRNMRQLIGAQRDVMLAYLGAQPVAHAAYEVAPVYELAARAPAVIDVAPAAAAPGAPPPAPEVIDPLQLVVSIVSERTGYPVETLGIDLDLEADLSIDSIKRIEIIGELALRLGLRVENGAGDADKIVEELATRKTLRGLVAWLTERLAQGDAASAPTPAASEVSELEEMATTPATSAATVRRFRLEPRRSPLPANGHATLAGRRVAIVVARAQPIAAIADALAQRLRDEGAIVSEIAADAADAVDQLATADELVELATTGAHTARDMRGLFERVRAAALAGARHVLVATLHGELGRGGPGGPAGLMKTVAAELPAIHARAIDLGAPGELTPAAAAALLHAELHADDPHVEIAYARGDRHRFEIVEASLDHSALPFGSAAGRGQAATVEAAAATAAEPRGIPLDRDSVVLVTGGARGITALAAIALGHRYGCHVELVGRSPLPGDADPVISAAPDARALRRLFAQRVSTPAEIEALCTRALADREIRATLTALGDRATYHAADVRSPDFAAVIDDVYRRHGRIDAVIHGAGVLDDKLLRHKTGESFERVFATKLAGAHTLVEKLRDDVKLVVWFSSISGAFGNRGQADYAAAGDALDKLAWTLQRKIAGRVVSIDWGPWGGTGMAADLEREYARRGIELIAPDDGIAALFDELRLGRDPQIVLSAADPRALLGRAESREPRVPVGGDARGSAAPALPAVAATAPPAPAARRAGTHDA